MLTKIAINTCYGGFGLSEEAYNELGLEWDGYGYDYRDPEKRTDPKLIAMLEKLGSKANGTHASISIIEVPENADWYIDEYDGIECIREGRVWA